MFFLDQENPKVLLAPMAGVGDVAFRRICLEHGADLTYTEMVSAKGLSYSSEKTRDLIVIAPGENSAAVQIFGHEPKVMAEQARWIEDSLGDSLAYIDVNMGCPARKIVSKGDGSALMKDPHLAAKIVESITDAVTCPVTVKFRRGYEMYQDISVSFAKMMESSGARAICVHGRYAMQYYKGEASWECIKAVKEAVSIPVVGNGDIKRGIDAKRMIEETGCDHVMIARSAMGNPWIFDDAKRAIAGCTDSLPIGFEERIDTMKKHARYLSEAGERAMVRMRKHAAAYVKGLPGASVMRMRLNTCVTLDDFLDLFDEYSQSVGSFTDNAD